ncbi:MAG TPA: malto-oligosyltrehalose trehalohydrolase [Pararhizobium sp.]|uniref:malto-oligosyltrehalose trehalohydrolase n=1 Tax=Pararhizobium sp. TaxID=1977563 RepID=UPI002C1AA451|nr:malto-oligosyltrehalose trehalohydrolase [Pararhizobium sp.]HTO30380.1 malto-oligosyltrehalose trehalohydrolase [Pararhizobium sp.]
MDSSGSDRESPVNSWGTDVIGEGRVRFRIWAPDQKRIDLRLGGRDLAMSSAPGGWFEIVVPGAIPGQSYSYVLDDGTAVPDPASRAQADDAGGPSLIVDPLSYSWKHGNWRGRPWHEAIIYELHIGTFTPEGTFTAAIGKLAHVSALGITAIEIMPVAHFGGKRGWGYDGVFHYAPHNAYGSPDDMKALIDAAHGHGLMVILDVVYNHFGPEGNYVPCYATGFFHADKHTPWGTAIAFEQPAVRDYFIGNALYWLGEFHLDGLRFDAVDRIDDDDSDSSMVVEIASRIRERFGDRHIHLITEDPRNLTDLRRAQQAGVARLYDGDWNDDFHHAVHVFATGETMGHYSRFSADPLEKVGRALAEGYVFPGEPVSGGKNPAVSPAAFINFLQNHDQMGNRAFGERLISLVSVEMLRALTAITMLSPSIPMLFMGEEFGETRPFLFFADYTGELADAVRKGRVAEAENFGGLPAGCTEADLPDPNAAQTMQASKLDWSKPDTPDGRAWTLFMQDLIRSRNQFVLPLLARADDDNCLARLAAATDGILAIDWVLGSGHLQLRANLGKNPATAPPIGGEIFYADGPSNDFPADALLLPNQVFFARDRVTGFRRLHSSGR